LDHAPTSLAVRAERAVSRAFGGSCQIPLAAFATFDDGQLHLRAMVATPDGTRVASAEARGLADQPEALGQRAAQILQTQDAAAILAVCQADSAREGSDLIPPHA
ncbi:MAG: hydroxymethylbilane synthase, partial [Pseudomonadota bacterium]|nr:hydroxymethylbilane synthase [Pseudomonadota bacterium]